MNNPVVTIEMENGKKIVAELYPEKAPNTVNNFISLVNSGFYDGLTFHRIIRGFMIQGGDPAGTGAGGPGYSIKGEFALNGFAKNDIKHLRGVLSNARKFVAPRRAVRCIRKGNRRHGCCRRDSICAHRLQGQAPAAPGDEKGHLRNFRRRVSRPQKSLRAAFLRRLFYSVIQDVYK